MAQTDNTVPIARIHPNPLGNLHGGTLHGGTLHGSTLHGSTLHGSTSSSPVSNSPVAKVAMVSTFPPTRCGIATFAAATRTALLGSRPQWDIPVVDVCNSGPNHATNPTGSDSSDTSAVVVSWEAGSNSSLAEAATMINTTDVLLLQHEFGIFGGIDGAEILDLLEAVRVPVIVELHTVLETPSLGQHRVVAALGRRASSLIVMSEAAKSRLLRRYPVPASKVIVMPHGAHPTTTEPPLQPGRVPLALTWGLVGPGKGLERAIDAVAGVVRRGIDVRYRICGETHPKVKEREGERYRESLIERARALGIADHVEFDATYRTVQELMTVVAQADVVLVPYDTTEQVTSGVLIEALAAGRPVIATAFPHAIELLVDGVGIVVDHDSHHAMAHALATVITNPARARAMSEQASIQGASALWPAIGDRLATLIEDAASTVEDEGPWLFEVRRQIRQVRQDAAS
jgi:polysaccharide biosynthesis protein PslF